jgi:hypothetical protein
VRVRQYTRSDREIALAALDDLLSGPGWTRLVAEAEAEFWGELDPEQTALADNETIALMREQAFDWWLFFDYEHEPGRYVVDALLEVAQGLPRAARHSRQRPSFIEVCGSACRDEGARSVARRRISALQLRELPERSRHRRSGPRFAQ